VEFLTPPVCREVVLGDLYERYRSPLRYISDAWYAIPCVVYSRIRRTADPGVLLMDAMLLYASFIGAAWQLDRDLLYQHSGLLRIGDSGGRDVDRADAGRCVRAETLNDRKAVAGKTAGAGDTRSGIRVLRSGGVCGGRLRVRAAVWITGVGRRVRRDRGVAGRDGFPAGRSAATGAG